MNYYEKFKKDLKGGTVGEKAFALFLNEKHNFEIIGFNDDYRYDIITKKKDEIKTFEVKTDRYEFLKNVKTGNMFIETSFRNKPSGISSTQADYFVYYLPDFEEVYIISSKKLRELLHYNQDKFRWKDNNGDGGRVTGYIIDRYKYKSLFSFSNISKDYYNIFNKPKKSSNNSNM